MTTQQSGFAREFGIIPQPAKIIAAVVFIGIQVLLFFLFRHQAQGLPLGAEVPVGLLGGTVLASVILLVGYVNADSRRRGMNSVLWTLVVIFVPHAIGFIIYFVVRRPIQMPCPKCGASVAPEFNFCPHCRQPLSNTCACGARLQAHFVCCPACGRARDAQVTNT